MKSLPVKSNLFKRYLRFNLLMILIPVILLVYTFANSLMKQIIKEHEMSQRYALLQSMRSIDASFEEFKVTAIHISTDSHITPFNLQNYLSFNKMDAMQRLKVYHSRTDFVYE